MDTNDIIVDNFAGGGGATEGIVNAVGRPVDVAINHDREALAMHEANHPLTKHIQENVWKVEPAQVRMCGNSVCPDVAEALVRANVGGYA